MKANPWRLFFHLGVVVLGLAVLAVLVSSGQKDLQIVNGFVNDTATSVLKYAVIVGAVGTVAMAFVELVKAMSDALRYFHELKVQQWITDLRAMDDLFLLAIGDRRRSDALFGQPLEKMMGQIQAAANIALDFPQRYPHLYGFLTTTDVKESPKAVTGRSTDTDRARADRETWMNYVATRRKADEQRLADAEAIAKPDAEQMEAARSRIRLANLATRKLDAFQLRTQYYWDRSNQFAAVLASVGIMYYALYLAERETALTLHSFLLGVLSGAIAPFAKDLTKRLTQLSPAA